MLTKMLTNMFTNMFTTNMFTNMFTAKLGKTFPVGWLGGWLGGWLAGVEKLGIRLNSASWGWQLAELGNKCRKRHPRPCRYFSAFQRCKFGEYCAFNHELTIDPILQQIKVMNERMEALKKQNFAFTQLIAGPIAKLSQLPAPAG